MIQIPQPCHKNWNDLDGGNQKKFCSTCNKYVYNLDQLKESQVKKLIELEENVCGMKKSKNISQPFSTKIRLTLVGFGLFVSNVFGQQDSIQVKGVVLDLDGLPVENAKVSLKNFSLNTFSNENGEFILNVPSKLGTYILVAEEIENLKIDVVLNEEQLKEKLIIPLKESNNIIMGSVVIESYKKSFKQRVINTITWPYRKIRDAFFKNE